jgi:hypothetical protein
VSAAAYVWVVLRRRDGSASVLAVPAPPPPRLRLGGLTYVLRLEPDPAGQSRGGRRPEAEGEDGRSAEDFQQSIRRR